MTAAAEHMAAAASGRALIERIKDLARTVERDPESIGVLSTGERCAVALLCNRADFLPHGLTFIEAVARLCGEAPWDWLTACIIADREGWKAEVIIV